MKPQIVNSQLQSRMSILQEETFLALSVQKWQVLLYLNIFMVVQF